MMINSVFISLFLIKGALFLLESMLYRALYKIFMRFDQTVKKRGAE